MTRGSSKRGQNRPGRFDRRRPQPKPRRRPKRSFIGAFFFWTATAAVWGIVLVAAVVAYYAQDLPDISALATPARQPSITVRAADGSTIATIGNQYGEYVDVKSLPRYLPQAVVAIEDRRFYEHFGVDLIGMARAAVVNLKAMRIVQGGSTITQQLAKNIFLSPERTIKRKIQETLLALWLERRFTKDQILTIYLNRVYFGGGAYGVDAAARRYFHKPARNVTLYEAAILAGLLKAPSRFAPTNAADLSTERANRVLRRMVAAHFITAAQAAHARKTGARFAKDTGPGSDVRYFVDWVVDQVDGFTGGIARDLVVDTTLDPKMQAEAQNAVTQMLDKTGKKSGVSQGALVALTPGGAIKAMVGGRDYGESQFNRATLALRQPGSAFKMFVYLAGIESGMSPDQLVLDAPITVHKWSPGNFDNKYLGNITLMHALADSRNTAAVRVAKDVGVKHVIEVAQRLGITSKLSPNLSIALGTSEVTLLELTAAYAALADDGIGVWPYGITEIRDWRGHLVYQRSGSGPGRVIEKPVVSTMARMLREVVLDGTGRNAAIDWPAAGKTGTSQDFRDAWFIGYTAKLVTGVWFGNDDGKPMHRVTGGRLPAKVWHEFMTAALKGSPKWPLPGLEAPPVPVAEEVPADIQPAAASSEAQSPSPGIPKRLKRNPGPGFWDQVMQNIGIGR